MFEQITTIVYATLVASAPGLLLALAAARLIGADGRSAAAAAVILELRDTGPTSDGDAQIELLLDVLPTDRPPFRATARAAIAPIHTSQVQPGMQVLVKYDPDDPGVIALAGFADERL